MQIASLLRSGADDDALAAAWVPLVCSRLIGGKGVPADIVKAARSCLNTPANVLSYKSGANELASRGQTSQERLSDLDFSQAALQGSEPSPVPVSFSRFCCEHDGATMPACRRHVLCGTCSGRCRGQGQ